MTPTEKLELQVDEELDGSAVVQLPDSEPSPQASENNSDDDDDGPSGDYEAKDGVSDNDPEREAIRAARREERKLKKQLHREKARESNHLISALKKQNNALADRLAVLEKKTSGAELARVDKAIDDAGVQVEYAKMKMKDAVSAQDGESLVQAQEMLYEAQRKMESLSNIKETATRQMSQQPKQNIQLPDPMVQRMAADWMSRNNWYDPQAKDLDSEIAQKIDRTLTEEGFDPTQEDYWEELDNRLQRSLPNRYTDSNNERTKRSRPRNVVTSSGREAATNAGGKNLYTLSPDRVKALKEAGMWDNLEIRNRMIKRYAAEDRQNNGRN